ncbi:hypothetical protein JW979_15825, partial [bacterium]|nr:hypothetical protein [candidate division CSSED10-310 bacterium]
IGAGGGTDVLTALKYNVSRIEAIELNPATIRMVKEDFRDFAGDIYSHPSVEIRVGEGRSELRRSRKTYDLIQMTGVDTWASSSQGAYVLSENFLYTVEAFKEYFDHLNPDGVLSIVRARFAFPRETLRLCSLARQMFRENGVDDPQKHVIVVSEVTDLPNSYAGFLLKKTPWTKNEIQAIRRFCTNSGFEIVGGAGCRLKTPFSVLLVTDKPEEIYKKYPFDISPVTDNKPYFFKFHRWHQLRMDQPLSRMFGIDLGTRPGTGHESGIGILVILLLQAMILSVIFIVYPVFKSGNTLPHFGKFNTLVYFISIGLGFIFVEISMIQHLTLVVGYPSRAITVTLFAILIGSGLGSLSAGTAFLKTPLHRITFAGSAAALSCFVYALTLPSFSSAVLGLPAVLRSLMAIIWVLIPAWFMGFMFPVGIASLRGDTSSIVPWAWCVNGCSSVLGSIIAVMISIDLGFSYVLMAGASLYLIAVWSGRRLVKTSLGNVPNVMAHTDEQE